MKNGYSGTKCNFYVQLALSFLRQIRRSQRKPEFQKQAARNG
jgi:hypothetical protein